jgi:hypothetical protein
MPLPLTRLTKLFLLILTVGLGCSLGLLFRGTETPAQAQGPTPCATPEPSANGPSGTWSPNHAVTVNLNPNDFNGAELTCLRQAFDNWNNDNGSRRVTTPAFTSACSLALALWPV